MTNVCTDLFDLADEISVQPLQQLRHRSVLLQRDVVCLFHVQRSSDLLKSIVMLCRGNHQIDAKILLRSFLNLYINLAWIVNEDEDARFTRYADHEPVFKKQIYDSTMPYIRANSDHDLARQEQAVRAANALKKYWGYDADKRVKSWTNKTLAAMAEDLELRWEYNVLYRYLSEIEHAGASAVCEYELDIGREASLIPIVKDTEFVMVMAIDLYLDTKAIACSRLGCLITDISYAKIDLQRLKEKYEIDKMLWE